MDSNTTPTLSDLAGPGFGPHTNAHYRLCTIWLSNEELLDIDGGDHAKAILKATTTLTGDGLDRAAIEVLWKAKEMKELREGIARYGAVGDGRPSKASHTELHTPVITRGSTDDQFGHYYDSSSHIPPNFHCKLDEELVRNIEDPPRYPAQPSGAIAIIPPSTGSQTPSNTQTHTLSYTPAVNSSLFRLPRRGSSAIAIKAPSDAKIAQKEQRKPSKLRITQTLCDNDEHDQRPSPSKTENNRTTTTTKSSIESTQPTVNRAFSLTNLALSRDPSSDDLTKIPTPSTSGVYMPPHRSSHNQRQLSMPQFGDFPQSIASDHQPNSTQRPYEAQGNHTAAQSRNRRRARRHQASGSEAEYAVSMPDTEGQSNVQQRRQNYGRDFLQGRERGWALDQPNWR